MSQDIDEIPRAAERLLATRGDEVAALAAALRRHDLRFGMVCGRGSSGHAGTFIRYLLGAEAGLVTAEASPSLASIYRRELSFEGALFILISQSGRSPDLVAMAEAARRNGAATVAIVNDPSSPSAAACAHVLAIDAGPERAIAATKSVINSILAGALLVAELADDDALREALRRLPQRLAQAIALDWSDWSVMLRNAPASLVIGRGYGYAAALEIALKLAETAALPSLAYSSAEFHHGPRALLSPERPALALRVADASAAGVDELIRGIATPLAVSGGPAATLPGLADDHPAGDALAMLAASYRAIEHAAKLRGRDPDAPAGLAKVTRTL
jgi:glucosamine--fructose-6-phosphate aminotransferase (isomerizing)